MITDLMDTVRAAAKRLGKNLAGDLPEVAGYAAERMERLSRSFGKPDFAEVADVERDNVALKLGIAAVDAADAADRELLGVLGGALTMGARALFWMP